MKSLLVKSSLVIVLFFMVSCGERVAPNYVGVLMQDYGKNGKSDFTLQKGRVSTWALGTELFQVPLFEQRASFENELHLKSADNTEFTAKPTYSYKVTEARAIDVVFDNKHVGSGDDFMKSIEDNILETRIYDLIKEESRKYVTDTLMSNGGSLKFEHKFQDIAAREFAKKGLELISFSAQLQFSTKVTAKIDQRNEVNTNVTVIDQQIIEQKKQNELYQLQAEGDRIRSSGITSQLLQKQFIDKWDGKTPIYGSAPFFIKDLKN
jgi:hypothetical protein